jgi:hypothetical protein
MCFFTTLLSNTSFSPQTFEIDDMFVCFCVCVFVAFCALIHRFRPDLIPFDTLTKDDPLRNHEIGTHSQH